MFEQAMRMFLPFGAGNRTATGDKDARSEREAGASPDAGDMDALRRQLDEMQKRLNELSGKD
jgi:polyhydroxyalkanoate synthesis regulator protein